jgi:hypothetical protein
MRSLIVALLAAIMVLFTVPSALAQSYIDLGAPTSGVAQFFGRGGGNFTLNICDHFAHGKCVGDEIQGPAKGVGPLFGYNGFYQIVGGGIRGTLNSGKNCEICRWTLIGSINFNWSTEPNGGGVDLLNGSFDFISMTQKKNVSGGGFNQFISVNFTPTGGLLLPFFVDNPTIELRLDFTTDKPIQRLRAGQTVLGFDRDNL